MQRRPVLWLLVVLLLTLLPQTGLAQNVNATISGTVTDPSGAAIPNAKVAVTSVSSGAVAQTTTGRDGYYSFANLTPGMYNLRVSATGFSDYAQNGIQLAITENARQDVALKMGAAAVTMEVLADSSPLNFDNPTLGGGITPDTLKDLPLLVSGNPRSAIAFAILEPGVTTGGQANPFNARINGGLQSGDEALLDGASMQEGFMNQNGMVSLYQDWPVSPDMVSEVKVLTSNYSPQYGSTTSGVLEAVTKSGTETLHAGAYEYHRNTWLNARPWNAYDQAGPGTARPKNIQNDYGAFVGGPAKVKGLYGERVKTYFYVNYEAWRVAGGVNRPTLTIPSMKERAGDFSDWADSKGNLIPVYDPATTAANPLFNPNAPVSGTNEPFTRQQFMGCDGKTPNVICSTDPRLQNALANKWLQFLPTPNLPGALNNYVLPTPIPDTILAQTNYWLVTADQYVGSKHHIKESVYYQGAPPKFLSALPQQLANETFSAPQYTFIDRLNWDYTIGPTVLNHATFGYLDRNEGYGCVDAKYVGTIPQIPGVALHNVPPVVQFSDGFQSFGCGAGIQNKNVTRRPTVNVNDMVTWIRGKHQFKFGAEYRWIAGYIHQDGSQSGAFNFGRAETGLAGINSGNPVASFLLDQVDNGNATFLAISSRYPRQGAYIWFVGDTFRVTPKLTIDYGIRWDEYSPSLEKFDRLTFFDPLSTNSGAGGLRGRLAFAGNKWGTASFGRREPEYVWHKGFAPRIGLAYALNPKNVIRAGYGIFYLQAFYPGWNGGMSQDGFSTTASFSAAPYGASPAFLLSAGLPPPGPTTFTLPPVIDSTFDNGKNAPNYRPLDANRLPYAQQWNVSVEHQFTDNFYVNAAYVANKGTRLPSLNAPINVLNPSLLSMGSKLNDTFQSGMTSLDGVPIPYAGWIEQMSACHPTVAQALLPYPQYCGTMQGQNENAGSSTYHSLQIKAEKRMAHGMSLLASFTWSKLLSSGTDNTQSVSETWGGLGGQISPFERGRNKALALGDVPQILSLTYVYDLPFGPGQRFANHRGLLGKAVGGWEMSTLFRESSGTPFYFRSGFCNVPSQFREGCIPGILSGANPFAQNKSGFDPGKGPLFNPSAFESTSAFNFYAGSGSTITTLREFNYHDQSLALIKNTRITERLNFQLRAEFFNLWNWHIFNSTGDNRGGQGIAFNTDVSNGSFGKWNGVVSAPRNIQVGARLEF